MDVKGDIVAVVNVGPQTLPTFATLNLNEGGSLHQLKCADRDFEQLVMKNWALPDGPKHQNQIISRQMLQYPAQQNVSRPWLLFRGTELGNCNQVEFSAFAGFALNREPYVLDEQIMRRLVPSRLNHGKRLFHVPQ